MKIIHLVTGLGMGGAERQLAALVEDKGASGQMEHSVISLQDDGIVGKRLIARGVSVYCLNLQKSLKGLWALFKILRKEKPDILQTWLYHADLSGLIIGKLARVPVIIWNVRCSNMDMSRYSNLSRLILGTLVKLSHFPDAVVTNSAAGQEFHTKIGYAPRRWVKIPNGIDTEVFYPDPVAGQKVRQSLSIPTDAVVIGMIGRVDPMKDYTTFLRAVSQVSEEKGNVHCIIAGKDTDQTEWEITPSHFHRLGIYEHIPGLMNSLDIMVLSSAFGEGFPNVVGEAMACGVPVIVTDVGDAAEIVQNPAQVVQPGNVSQLVAALRHLLTLTPEGRKTIGAAGMERIKNLYSVPQMRKKYEDFYKTLILGKK